MNECFASFINVSKINLLTPLCASLLNILTGGEYCINHKINCGDTLYLTKLLNKNKLFSIYIRIKKYIIILFIYTFSFPVRIRRHMIPDIRLLGLCSTCFAKTIVASLYTDNSSCWSYTLCKLCSSQDVPAVLSEWKRHQSLHSEGKWVNLLPATTNETVRPQSASTHVHNISLGVLCVHTACDIFGVSGHISSFSLQDWSLNPKVWTLFMKFKNGNWEI